MSNTTAETTAARNLRAEGYDGFVAALLRYPENRQSMQQVGVTVSFLPLAQAGRELAQASLGQATVVPPLSPASNAGSVGTDPMLVEAEADRGSPTPSGFMG